MCMKNQLQSCFPIIRTREEVLSEIYSRYDLTAVFSSWNAEQQKEFVDFCSGVRGIKLLYDGFFKEIMNPEITPERLEEFLSLILKQKVKILSVLPNDSIRLADESSLLITDIVVELADGSIANVEIQKIGYLFPGARSACYSSDLLLRQYKRIRSRKKKNFSYKDIKNVYTIVLFDKSPKEFHQFSDTYLHHFEQKSDSGLNMDLLQKYVFISLDIFRKNVHNITAISKLDAWLILLSVDDPKIILSLIEAYPEFKEIYGQVYEICRNVEAAMELFSKELQELDRNTVQYMIDQMQEEINQMRKELNRKKEDMMQLNNCLNETDTKLNETKTRLNNANSQLNETSARLDEKELLYQAALCRIEELEQKLQSTT